MSREDVDELRAYLDELEKTMYCDMEIIPDGALTWWGGYERIHPVTGEIRRYPPAENEEAWQKILPEKNRALRKFRSALFGFVQET